MASFCSCRDELVVTRVLAVAAQRPGDLIEAHRIFKHERLMPASFAGGQTHGSVADEKPVMKAPWITPHLDPGRSADTVVTDRATRFDLVAKRRTVRERFKAVSPPDCRMQISPRRALTESRHALSVRVPPKSSERNPRS